MSGFEAYNASGYKTIDSDYRATVISTARGMPGLTDMGNQTNINSPFGNGVTLGFLPYNYLSGMTGALWFRLNAGNYCWPGPGLYEAGSGTFMNSSTANGISSGYLDVYNASGGLVWSAASAGTMPRIIDFITIPNGYDLSNNTLTMNLSYNPWICISQAPGNYSPDPEGGLGYSGFQFKWTGSQLQTRWVSAKQRTYPQVFSGITYKIALAQFTGY
jgi:hypothetical protein